MRFILVFTILGPALLSMCLTGLVMAPEEIVPFWPIFLIIPAAIAFTVFSQKIVKKYFDHDRDAKMMRIIAPIIGFLIGPVVYMYMLSL